MHGETINSRKWSRLIKASRRVKATASGDEAIKVTRASAPSMIPSFVA
jgi:hypothetical protein